MGKGWRQRPTNWEKYNENWDRIFGKNKEEDNKSQKKELK